ncbi:hypothetical protein COCVIDRAFT_31862 [Bipolaris victoriae FI3]|uniref:Uncharacterized protein n=1 Tax=Bipolaris victoriae (strain FI3) TaxID=930091 RepID=W7E476_BIPV3|nr:hypothetical protein COCVIDRAFT_31862 [Bipolaris victoriae FI3]
MPDTTSIPSSSAGLDDNETLKFRAQYFELEKLEADSIAGRMIKRYKLDQFYEQFETLDAKIRLQRQGTGRRGVRYDSVAKEVLFATTYMQELGREPLRETDRELWQKFGEKLDKGKRWNMIKRRIGSIGIFGLLPNSSDPDTFIEQRLTQARVGQWIEMVAACNEDARAMATRMEPLYMACVQGHPPPDEFSFLEQVDNVNQSVKPLVFLTRANIEEVQDIEELEYGSIEGEDVIE